MESTPCEQTPEPEESVGLKWWYHQNFENGPLHQYLTNLAARWRREQNVCALGAKNWLVLEMTRVFHACGRTPYEF